MLSMSIYNTQIFPLGMLIFGQTSINVFLYSFPEKLTTNFAILFILHPHLTVRIFPRVLILGPRRVKKRKARWHVISGSLEVLRPPWNQILPAFPHCTMVRRVKKFKNTCLHKASCSCCIEQCSKIESLKKAQSKVTHYHEIRFYLIWKPNNISAKVMPSHCKITNMYKIWKTSSLKFSFSMSGQKKSKFEYQPMIKYFFLKFVL